MATSIPCLTSIYDPLSVSQLQQQQQQTQQHLTGAVQPGIGSPQAAAAAHAGNVTPASEVFSTIAVRALING
jgi:hypothetical protein